MRQLVELQIATSGVEHPLSVGWAGAPLVYVTVRLSDEQLAALREQIGVDAAPAVEPRISALNLGPADAIVFEHPLALPAVAREKIAEKIEKMFPGRVVLVLDEGAKLSAVREEAKP